MDLAARGIEGSLLIFAAVIWGPLSWAAGLAVIAASWIPTAATHHLIEDPLRLSRVLARHPNRALAVGLGSRDIVSRSLERSADLRSTIDPIPGDPDYRPATPSETLRHF